MPALQEAVTSRRAAADPDEGPGLAAAITVFLDHVHSGILLVALWWLVLCREEVSLRQERLNFAGLHRLSMRMYRNSGQLTPTSDSKPVQHWIGPS